MTMIAPSNAGSRNGLITWAVVATILWVATLVWAIIAFAQNRNNEKLLGTLTTAYKDVVDQRAVSTNAYLVAAKNDRSAADSPYKGQPLADVLGKQREDLAALIGGAGTSTADAFARGEAAKAMPDGGAATSLLNAVETLKRKVADQQQALAARDAELKAANAQVTGAQTTMTAFNASADQKVAAATEVATQSQADADAYRKQQDEQLAAAQAALQKAQQEATDAAVLAEDRAAGLQRQVVALQRQVDQLVKQRELYQLPVDQIVRQADGRIIRLAGTDRVFIDLGRGQQIAPGMTFEVFDKAGVPTVRSAEPADDRQLQGKASIEVLRVQQGNSECRVVRTAPGSTIVEGDPIVNVVYDRNVKNDFHVFGKFNLDRQGQPGDRDTEIVKQLVTRWGGNVTDKVDTETDFVVLGIEPVVPSYSEEETQRDPLKAFEVERATQDLADYQNKISDAQRLNIPILNQTRFLYLVGYYDEAAR